MRALNIKILILIAVSWLLQLRCIHLQQLLLEEFSENIHILHQILQNSTGISRNALDFGSKSKDLNILKANIDTAELICVEKNIEFPSLAASCQG